MKFPFYILSYVITKLLNMPLKIKLIDKSPKKTKFLKDLINKLHIDVEVMNQNILKDSKKLSKKNFIYPSNYKSSRANKSEVSKFLKFIIQSLDKNGFLQPDHKRQSMIRNIENIFYRTNLSGQEIRILLGIFSTLNKFNKKS